MYVRDLGFGFPARTWARVQRQTGKSPVFLFFFERAAPDEPKRGAHHGVELSYAFHTVGLSARPFEDVDRTLSDVMSSYWVQFASTGDPNGMGRPKWPAYDSRRDTLLVFGDKIEEHVVPQKAALDLFEASFDGRGGRTRLH
jgi:para-nitrobenzyl esterase